MKFASPNFLSLLFVLPLIWLIAGSEYLYRKKIIKKLFSPRAREAVLNIGGGERFFLKLFFFSVFIVFTIVALARPQWGEKLELIPERNLNFYFLLDSSLSMLAEDVAENRFQIARRIITLLVDRLRSDQVALINFAAAPYLQSPLTFDRDAFKILLDVSQISPQSDQGTDFRKLFEYCLQLIEIDREGVNVFFLISDGEDHSGNWVDLLQKLKKERAVFFTIGVGRASSIKIPLRNEAGVISGYKRDLLGNEVETSLQALNLRTIADLTGGKYFYFENEEQILKITQQLQAILQGEVNRKFKKVPQERFYFPLGVALLAFVAFLIVRETK